MSENIKNKNIVLDEIKKCKRYSSEVLKKHFWNLLLCWCLTAVLTFGSFGIYWLFELVEIVFEKDVKNYGLIIGIVLILPIYFGNIVVAKRFVNGEKTNVYSLFDCCSCIKRFWKWIYFFVISIAPEFVFALVMGAMSESVNGIFHSLSEDALFYFSALLEFLTLIILFFLFCKGVYFISLFDIDVNPRKTFEAGFALYLKNKKYFIRYVLSNFYLIIIPFLIDFLPLAVQIAVIVFDLGYFTLIVASFSKRFNGKFDHEKNLL